MKRFILIVLFLLTGQQSFSLEIVYPKKNNVKINSKSTFFIGNTSPDEQLTINETNVNVVENGGFAQIVPLKIGENVFTIKSGKEILVYKIYRPKPVKYIATELIEYPEMDYKTKKDNATLRSTPIDEGINRLSQLPKNTRLIVNGEQGKFFRVKLSNTETGWILKSETERTEESFPIKIKQLRCKKDKEFIYYRFRLSDKIPFSVLNHDEKILLKFYNTNINLEICQNYGFDYYYDECGNFILKVRYKIPKIPTITIDAGHGGVEQGAIGCCGDKEKDINLKISQYLKQELKKDFNVILTRDDDSRISLQDRVAISKQNNSTLLISIHSNALPDGEDPNKNRGTSVYYYHNQAKSLAENILKEITKQVNTNDDRVRQRSLALVRPTQSISVLVEVGYMINPYDNIMLTNSDFQKNTAKAIADAIRNYFDKL